MRPALLLAAALLGAPRAEAGLPVPLEDKVFRAELIVEYELPFDGQAMKASSKGSNAVMASGPTGAALARARLVRVIFPPASKPPERLPPLRFVASGENGCVALAAKRGKVRALLFFVKGAEGWEQLFGVEQRLPGYTDLDPAWPQFLAAVEQAAGWRAGAEPPQDAPKSDDRFLRRFAARWLARKQKPSADELVVREAQWEPFAEDCLAK